MKLPLSKKMMMFAGIGVVIIGIAIVGMRFLKKDKTPPEDSLVQEGVKGDQGKEGAEAPSVADSNKDSQAKDKEEEAITILPSAYKKNVTKIFKPLSSYEIARMLEELQKEKNEYERRKEHLDFKEKVLTSMETDLKEERKELENLKQDLSKFLDFVTIKKEELKRETIQIDAVESKNIKKLASVYGSMKPQKAAMILKEMDEETAVKLLTMMDQKTSAKVLESIEPSLAVKFSERLKVMQYNRKSIE